MTAEMKPLDLSIFNTWASGAELYIGCGVNECSWENSWYTFETGPMLDEVLNEAIQHTFAAHM